MANGMQPIDEVTRGLRALGPCRSSRLIRHLVQELRIKEDAARKRLSRSKGVERLPHILLPHREKFLFLPDQHGSSEFWGALLSDLVETNSAYGVAMESVMARGSVGLFEDFETISGSPARTTSKSQRFSAAEIRHALIQIGWLEEVQVGSSRMLAHGDVGTKQIRRLSAVRSAEAILLKGLKSWVRKMGFASWGKVRTREDEEKPMIDPFQWDLSGPSYIYPLRGGSAKKTRPGFIGIDITLGQELPDSGARYFDQKSKLYRKQKNSLPLMSILVAQGFSESALKFGRGNGLVLATPEVLFGEEVGKGLKEFIQLMTDSVLSSFEPQKVEQLFNRHGSIEGAALNLRGALFELLVGYCVREREGGGTEIGRILDVEGKNSRSTCSGEKGKRPSLCMNAKGSHRRE